MKNLTLRNICKAVRGTYHGKNACLDETVTAVTTDSRTVIEGALFIAINGEKVDGHSYIPAAYERGALCCLSEQPLPDCIIVDSTLQALKDLAAFYLAQLPCKVIGITGSVGKTSTKEMIASVLSQRYRVLKTQGNFNNAIGLPLTIFRLSEEDEIAVLEMGISDFGEMNILTKIARPDVAVITNIGQCHLENLRTRDGILRAKCEIFTCLKEDGQIILNGDDDKLSSILDINGITPRFFGLNAASFASRENYTGCADAILSKGLAGTDCTLHLKTSPTDEASLACEIPVHLTIPGEHMVYNALAGALAGQIFGLTPEEIKAGIEALTPVDGRNHIFRSGGFTIIDDCYNANPVSMRASIDVVSAAPGRSVCILGDMFELGENEAKLHYETGLYLGEHDVNVLYTVGALGRQLAEGAKKTAGERALTIQCFDTLEEFLAFIKKEVPFLAEDTILIKASHGMQFSKIVDYFKSV